LTGEGAGGGEHFNFPLTSILSRQGRGGIFYINRIGHRAAYYAPGTGASKAGSTYRKKIELSMGRNGYGRGEGYAPGDPTQSCSYG